MGLTHSPRTTKLTYRLDGEKGKKTMFIWTADKTAMLNTSSIDSIIHECVRADGREYNRVVARHGGYSTWLFKGTSEECDTFMRNLFGKIGGVEA